MNTIKASNDQFVEPGINSHQMRVKRLDAREFLFLSSTEEM